MLVVVLIQVTVVVMVVLVEALAHITPLAAVAVLADTLVLAAVVVRPMVLIRVVLVPAVPQVVAVRHQTVAPQAAVVQGFTVKVLVVQAVHWAQIQAVKAALVVQTALILKERQVVKTLRVYLAAVRVGNTMGGMVRFVSSIPATKDHFLQQEQRMNKWEDFSFKCAMGNLTNIPSPKPTCGLRFQT
jgi:hypothetical protein